MNRVEVESQRAAPGMAALWAVPGYPSLAAAVLLLGLASSLAGPYMGLYGTNAVGMSPAALLNKLNALPKAFVTTTAKPALWSAVETGPTNRTSRVSPAIATPFRSHW